jgi:hypothetical protein
MKRLELRRPGDAMLLRLGSGAALSLGFGASRLAWDGWSLLFMASAAAGLLLAYGIVAIWGERTRPRFNLFWLLVLIVLGVPAFASLAASTPEEGLIRYAPIAIFIGLFVAHNHVLGPTLLIAGPIFLALFPIGFEWQDATDQHAWFIAFASLFGILAGTLERDRLHARTSPPIPWLWTVVRGGLVTVWTILVMFFKEELQVGRLFAGFGLDPRGEIGRWALLALFLGALVAASFLFRGKKTEPTKEAPATT